MRVVFFGSPAYAIPTLRGLLAAPGVEVAAVVTQPARPRGRSGEPVPTPAARLAAEAGAPVLTPQRITRAETAALAALAPDAGVLAAYAHLLPSHLLDAFPHGVLNVHASLLPRHRGASPVAAAILAGDDATGATIMRVARALDAGPVLGSAATPIGPLDDAGTLTDRVAGLGARLLLDLLGPWVAGEIAAEPQDEALATWAPALTKSDGALDWRRPAGELWRRVRAFRPWPLASTARGGQPLIVHEAWPVAAPGADAEPGAVLDGGGAPLGEALPGRRARAVVACGEGGLALLRVQRAGRRAQDIEDYLRGDRSLIGSRLGEAA